MLGLLVNDEYVISEAFGKVAFLKKLVLMGVWGRFTLYKYMSCWMLAEGSCILFGKYLIFYLTKQYLNSV